MNWIILIVAGLFETAFAFCLGKMKGKRGEEYRLWGYGLYRMPHCQHVVACCRCTDFAHWYSLSGMDGHRSGRDGIAWHCMLP